VPRKRAIDGRAGARLLEIRKTRSLSQARLAKAIGVTTGTIQAYEHSRARITVERLEALAEALQCEPAELLAPPGARLLPRYPSRRI
jgi:transcriptional regulator with XRE-family HTH domain